MLLNRETAFGVSLHYLDEGFDTGDIIEQRRVAISPDDNLYQIYRKLFVEGTKMAIAAISSQQGQNNQRQPQAAGGRYDSWPTASQVKAFSQQGNRLVSSGSFWNSLVKPELV